MRAAVHAQKYPTLVPCPNLRVGAAHLAGFNSSCASFILSHIRLGLQKPSASPAYASRLSSHLARAGSAIGPRSAGRSSTLVRGTGRSSSDGDIMDVPSKFLAFMNAAGYQFQKFTRLSGRFLPMVALFFLMAFVNTILDSLKDTLVITAIGGGAQVIPYLTVYAVLPSSLVFLFLYSSASQFMTRTSLFNAIVVIFMAFFAFFAFVLYPSHELLHPHQLADSFEGRVPAGLSGLIGMFRNWTFTIFFCISELWGDVCLGLLFWGLANDTTSLCDAHTLYPLFGLGANVAQSMAGLVLKAFSGHGASAVSFADQIRTLMMVVLGFSAATLAMYAYVDKKTSQRQDAERQKKIDNKLQARIQRQEQGQQVTTTHKKWMPDVELANTDLERLSSNSAASTSGTGVLDPHVNYHAAVRERASDVGEKVKAVAFVGDAGSSQADLFVPLTAHANNQSINAERVKGSGNGSTTTSTLAEEPRPTLLEIYRMLAASVPIQCLAIMSVAMGLCSNLMEFAWKSHIKLLCPSPGDFTAFMGDVSTWQGLVTGALMVASPTIFRTMGWKGVAAATPQVLLVGGVGFFACCILYQCLFAPDVSGAAASAVLLALVYGGAALYVFGKSAKFSLFKPAEEMVYISLDEQGRTKGKAAIDVVGSQAGKSGGSILQQLLLVLSSGAIGGSLPIMFIVYSLMAQGWLKSVAKLSMHNPMYGHSDSVHPTLSEDTDSEHEGQSKKGFAESSDIGDSISLEDNCLSEDFRSSDASAAPTLLCQ
ncbi:hypothetical protein CEUSTIGMA_g3590.t1 [Chlamydomonas eustigma]|uniref:ADP,ATP carrier protein n=1 Tax=Chlamydomonas eustigma TaxID=1157962 RepID=A0A250WZE0_9CHLO|nr:hypothetical protein CEUSTIGMA_g3590.t1 [Chlamydomonas eustigma]|eukprot:GAX76146.1 hypothetical protein CEUSTIGMA_g3590.t1 [Chlamydomonas eustigma]